MNLSILIPTYTDHENVFNLLTYLKKEGVTLNNIFVVSDKIEEITGEDNIDKIVTTLMYKTKIHLLDGITIINKEFHGGRSGTVNYIYDLPISNDENLIVLEDDLFAKRKFFEQCEKFFKHIRSDSKPIFVGYSRTNTQDEKFFETYNLLHLWGFALKFGDLKTVIAYHDKVRKYDRHQKEEIIKDVLKFTYPCPIFEKYKVQLINRVKNGFLSNSKESADLYFMFYFLQNKVKIIKNTDSNIQSFRPEIRTEKSLNDVESDIVEAINLFVD